MWRDGGHFFGHQSTLRRRALCFGSPFETLLVLLIGTPTVLLFAMGLGGGVIVL